MTARPLALLLAGLGNPPFRSTRHDAGALLLDAVAARLPARLGKSRAAPVFKTDLKHAALAASITVGLPLASQPAMQKPADAKSKGKTPVPPTSSPSPLALPSELVIHLVKPTTFMNLSGTSLSRYSRTHDIPAHRMLVLHDEAELASGAVKSTSSSTSQNGIRDIKRKVGKVSRIAIGIGRPPKTVAMDAWVLGAFTPEEWTKLKQIEDDVTDRVEEWIRSQVDEVWKGGSGKL